MKHANPIQESYNKSRTFVNSHNNREKNGGTSMMPPTLQLKAGSVMQRKDIRNNKEEEEELLKQPDSFQFKKPFSLKKEEEEELPVQGKFNKTSGSHSLLQRKSSANGLPDELKSNMESSFQQDFSNVKVHPNSGNASKVGALAYTQGHDIHFAPGQFRPDSRSGQELIGHELTHVVQQSQGRVKPTTEISGMAVNDDPKLEQEADLMGKKALQGKFNQPSLQKKCEDCESEKKK